MAMMEKQSSMDSEGNFTPQPADTDKYTTYLFTYLSSISIPQQLSVMLIFKVIFDADPMQINGFDCLDSS